RCLVGSEMCIRDSGNGQGKNRLGYLLMALRGQLAAEK
ncbi:hypothetical protein ACX3V1_01135, partial [Escherichia coli]